MFSSSIFLVSLHSILRWLVLVSLILAIFRAYRGFTQHTIFTKTDNLIRHWTATIAHIQLVVGMTLYIQNPVIKYFWANFKEMSQQLEVLFFGIIHIFLMLVAIVILTIGSAMAKRKSTDKEKFKTMLVWFSLALFIIFIAIPWPFSPLANRPYIRTF
ncbi:hypothetical protein [Emticicia sp. W12TSBA100-4]|uniref:hypothetical protein n=1 Tax=Emticicia sp. W12TSBA100-4 TaxID=3160965 RepID=UPI0033066314